MLQMARGGVCNQDITTLSYVYIVTSYLLNLRFFLKILADAMGLGKTIMTIALLLTHKEIGESLGSWNITQPLNEGAEIANSLEQSPNPSKRDNKFSSFNRLMKQRMLNGGCLIVCPMTLLGQWKVGVIQ